ncbi:subunit P of phosphatidylinositol N-acetylglucosaminyltransferase [Chloropicon primus]|uniref:PIG-P domain-containing protein n=1 Tax=Chloropicon primus TaxID=1764295 RepID=A0A5B8MXN0_9CHLO|nr:hypothetical protein A3770_13p69730 [Chloropicon primus]UPR03664.1 subunit P of phosphatidylinositol N-acetylglucosaminyltransferase [Chloropicon primus]|mmetsp:Transcript_14699/g.30618  ORF Transcript_14699/g.30618 Transcript_14699/m.30618 type:complete len:163 (+) Transcript_14699:240-728(+)|eukprot:QDZ24455.1 hypothetical protein A3770_13p69730 [Chloropicon primus]
MLGKLRRRVSSLARERDDARKRRRDTAGARTKAIHVGEIYGFVGAMTTTVFTVVYFAWAYTPEKVLHAVGIYYYPSKYWALALPVWLSVLAVVMFWLYEFYNLACTPPLHSLDNVRDEHCRWKEDLTEEQRKMPVLYDMPLEQVNALLFGGAPRQRDKKKRK